MVPDTSNVDYDYWELIPDEGSMPVRAESVGKRLLAALRNLLEQQNGGTLAEQPQRNLRNFHVLQELETYDDFFDGGILCPPEASPRTQLRFRLLKKHGNCRTRRAIIVRPEKNDPDSDLSASEWETLLNPLLYNSRLEELYVNSCDSVDMAVQNKVYSIVGEVLRTSSSLQYLFLEMKGVSAANVARLARGLEQNRGSNLEALVFLDRPEASAMKHVWEMIERAPRLRHLWLKKPGALDDVGVEAWAEAVRRSTSLVKLTVEDTALDGRVSKLLSESFTGDRRNSSVKHLELIKLRGAAAGWKSVFDALRLNTTVNRLEFWGCESLDSEAAFGNLVALLNVNSTLQMIKNRGAPSSEKDMKDLLIEKLLDRNDYRRSYFSVLRDAKLPFVSAKSGTLLLCGSPLSGKTRLKTTMQKVLKNQSCTEAFTETVRSTRGIEVEMMRNDDKMQISLWDLSGQEIYRDVQHRLVPRGNQAHVYVFVFSPFELQGAGNNVHQRKQNLESAFWTELLYLLRSVASLTTTTLYIPMVVVVITHADLLTDEEKDVAWATKIVGEFRSVFDGVVGICTDVHQINAKDEADVGQMMQRVLYLFETLLQTATHIIPSACAELSSIIQQQHWNLPVWNRLQFYEFCHQNSHAEALGSFRLAFSAGSKEWKAVLEYLHDVRVIFLVPNSDLVIVDLNWLASSFLGELISMIDNHPAKDSTICFIDAKSLQSILGTLVTERLETYHFDHIFLKELLVKLIFCYRRAGEEGFLAPTLIRRKKSQAE